MVTAAGSMESGPLSETIASRYQRVRALTMALIEHLEPEDCVVQSMPDVSPSKWHLAHTTWFFERFVVTPRVAQYRSPDPQYDYLFNSYYYTAGRMHARPERGLLSRPTLKEVCAYRAHVDEAVLELLEHDDSGELHTLIELGCQHEQQHQELLLTDIKHVLWCNPLKPAMRSDLSVARDSRARALSFTAGVSGTQQIGAVGDGFCFDNETPQHEVLVCAHELADRLITNQEYRAFIEDGAYTRPDLWLSDGWAAIQEHQWQRPLYWCKDNATEFTLAGMRELVADAPVSHVSYYEADAYARWAGARLPGEAEWELAAAAEPVDGNFLDAGYWQPVAAGDHSQFFGDVWEWTSSAYLPYPGFKPLAGSLGEYNGKFMANQMVVRGGSCLSSADHLRASYRSFFYPHQRWQCLGFRLARDL